MAAGLAVALVLTGCGSSTTDSTSASGSGAGSASASSSADSATVLPLPDLKGQTVVINTFGGSYGDAVTNAVAKPFEEATGANVVVTTKCCDTYEQSVKSGQFAGDVVMGRDYGFAMGTADKGLYLDEPRLAEIAKARGLAPTDYQKNMIAIAYYANVLAWNTNSGPAPASWKDFFDTTKFTGTRGLLNYAMIDLEASLIAQGVQPDALYPLDVPKSLAGVAQLQKNAKVIYWGDGADMINKLGTGEINYTVAWSNRVVKAIQEGLPMDLTFSQGIREANQASIPKTAKNVDGAVAFIDFLMTPKIQAAFADASGMSPAYPAAAALVDPAIAKYMVTAPENYAQTIPIGRDFWRTNYDSVYSAFEKVMNQN